MRDEAFEKVLTKVISIDVKRNLAGYPSEEELSKTYCLSENFYKKMEMLIQHVEKKEVIKKCRIKVYICAACLLLLFVCWQPEAVVNAGKSIWEWFDTYISFYLGKDVVMQEYQMNSIPEGYKLIYEYLEDNNAIELWKNEHDDEIELIYTYAKNNKEFDNQGKDFLLKYDGDISFYYLETDTDDRNIMLWEDKESGISFTLISTLPYDEMIKIRQSVTPVEEP